MQNIGYGLPMADLGNFVVAGNDDALYKQSVRNIENMLDKRLVVKACQQLIAAEAQSAARCHDNAADGVKGILFHHKHLSRPRSTGLAR